MPRTPRMKLARTEKQKAADKKNLAVWEAKQAEEARISNDKEVFERGVKFGRMETNHVRFVMGIVVGSCVVLIACFIGLGI